MRLEKYLLFRLPDYVHNEKQAFIIIQSIISNLNVNIRNKIMENLWYENAQICEYKKCTGIGINIPNIMRIVQFKVSNFITLTKLLQWLGRGSKDKSRVVITIVFVHSCQVLLNNMHIPEQSTFKNLRLSISKENCKQIIDIIAQLYKTKLQLAKQIKNAYEKTNLRIFQFLNTSQYKQQLILVYFICKIAFKLFPDLADCCKNCMYNHTDASQVPDFELHDITARLLIICKRILKYLKLQLLAKCNCLCKTNLSNLKTIAKQALICKKALHSFARQRQPKHIFFDIEILSGQRKQLAKVAIYITTIE